MSLSYFYHKAVFSTSSVQSLSCVWYKCKSEKVIRSVMSYSLWSYGLYPPGSSVHEILQARILEWVAIPFSRGSYWPRDRTCISCIAGRFFTIWATREALFTTLVKWLMFKTSFTPKNPTDGGSPQLKMEGNAEDAGPSLPLTLWHSAAGTPDGLVAGAWG